MGDNLSGNEKSFFKLEKIQIKTLVNESNFGHVYGQEPGAS